MNGIRSMCNIFMRVYGRRETRKFSKEELGFGDRGCNEIVRKFAIFTDCRKSGGGDSKGPMLYQHNVSSKGSHYRQPRFPTIFDDGAVRRRWASEVEHKRPHAKLWALSSDTFLLCCFLSFFSFQIWVILSCCFVSARENWTSCLSLSL